MTIDRETHPLPPNFTVFATQNPIEYEGTYPLPEAQKDRFMLKITMQAPDRAEELALAQRTMTKDAPETVLASGAVQPVIQTEDLQALREELARHRHARRTGRLPGGHRPRHAPARKRAGRRRAARHAVADHGRRAPAPRCPAAISSRPDDIKAMAPPVLEHRLILRPEFEIEGLTVAEVIQQILQQIAVPR